MECFVQVWTPFLSAIGTSRSKTVRVEFDKEELQLHGVADEPLLEDDGRSCARVVDKSAVFLWVPLLV